MALFYVIIKVIWDASDTIVEQAPLGFVMVLLPITITAYMHEVFIWLPTFLFLRKRHEITKKISIKCGALIGAIPVTIFSLPNALSYTDAWPLVLMLPLIFGASGAAIGYMFWRIGIKPVDSK